MLTRARIVLLWLLAAVVPLQCGAAVIRVAAGPMHGHGAGLGSTGVPTALHDFRRLPASGSAHAHGPGQRHHHAAADASVVAGDDAFERTTADDEDAASASAAFASLLPLASAPCPWQADAATDAERDPARWWASSRTGARLERPPRLG